MAYIGQDKKAALLPGIKAALAKYGVRGTVAIRHHSTLVINIAEGPLDFIANYNAHADQRAFGRDVAGWRATDHLDVNPYHYRSHFSGDCLAFLVELIEAANVGNHDRSDLMTDYFDVGWYVDVNVGKWNKPYRLLVAQKEAA